MNIASSAKQGPKSYNIDVLTPLFKNIATKICVSVCRQNCNIFAFLKSHCVLEKKKTTNIFLSVSELDFQSDKTCECSKNALLPYPRVHQHQR